MRSSEKRTTSRPPHYRTVRFNRDILADRMLEHFTKKQAKLWNDLSPAHHGTVREEFITIIQNLEESLATSSPAFLVDHARWLRTRAQAESYPPGFAPAFFQTFKETIEDYIPPDFRAVALDYAKQAIAALKSPMPEAGEPLEIQLSAPAQAFLDLLLAGEVGKARTVIDRQLAAGTSFRGIYQDIFSPVLTETGRRWQMNSITIAQEHFITSVILRIMEQIHDHIISTGRLTPRKKTVVTACVGEELHDVGIRMVADFFDIDGWTVYYTGANTPVRSIISAVEERNADVLALSITMPSYLSEVEYLIRSLRAGSTTVPVKIIVGGYPFTLVTDLWQQVGADAVAGHPQDAVELANRLTKAKKEKT
ncbi:MAG: hypothetical protein GYA23_05705 [Methanomicrobiales archaeon]|nr:hypothetical protein [Methanomicrobiales archaeon]